MALPCLSEARALVDRPPSGEWRHFSLVSAWLYLKTYSSHSICEGTSAETEAWGEATPSPALPPAVEALLALPLWWCPARMVKSTLLTKIHLVKAMVFPVVIYGCDSWTIKKRLSAEELMFLNCGAGQDSWESLGQQGNQNSKPYGKSIWNIHCKDWCWSWSSNSLATWW